MNSRPLGPTEKGPLNHMKNSPAPAWYSVPENLADLLTFLRDRCEIDSLDEAIRVVGEPWHYDAEYDAMTSAYFADLADDNRVDAILEERGPR